MVDERKVIIDKRGGYVDIQTMGTNEIHDYLPSGVYTPKKIPSFFGGRLIMSRMELKIPSSATSIAKRIVDFEYLDIMLSNENKAICEALNVRRKVGYLLHGIQGSGKTTTLQAIAQLLMTKYEAITFVVEDMSDLGYTLDFMEVTRQLKHYPACIIFDECEKNLRDNEEAVKLILDGYRSPDDCVFLFATNYLHQIPDSIKERPSRFKYVIDIGKIADAAIVYDILVDMNNTLPVGSRLEDKILRDAAPKGVGQTLDFVKNMFFDTCFEAIKAKRNESSLNYSWWKREKKEGALV